MVVVLNVCLMVVFLCSVCCSVMICLFVGVFVILSSFFMECFFGF